MPWLTPAHGKPIDSQFPEGFLALWQRLAATTDQADPVCCAPAWQLAFHEVFTPDRAVFYCQGPRGIIIFSEYFDADGNLYLLPLEDSWLFGQPLLGDDAPFMLAEAMPELVDRNRGKAPPVFISGVQEPSLFASALFQRFHTAFAFYRQEGCTEAGASLEGGLDGWLSRRSANTRAKLRKALRLAGHAGIAFERSRPTPADVEEVYDRMVAVERKSWKGLGHCGMAESPSLEFYRALIKRHAANNAALVIFAKLENEDMGFIFGGICGNIYRGQQFSYAETMSRLSLGNILQSQKIAWLCELGVTRYDMGPSTGERMGYKTHWTEEFRNINTWIMRR